MGMATMQWGVARAIFAPQTDPRFGDRWAGHVVGSLGLSMFTGRRATR